MEPRSAERGNAAAAPGSGVAANRLQWSHAQLSVEILMRRLDRAYFRRASMEPRSAERGNLGQRQYGWQQSSASMEPRSAERGNLECATNIVTLGGASMEPRSAERGNTTACSGAHERGSCFNGATLS